MKLLVYLSIVTLIVFLIKSAPIADESKHSTNLLNITRTAHRGLTQKVDARRYATYADVFDPDYEFNAFMRYLKIEQKNAKGESRKAEYDHLIDSLESLKLSQPNYKWKACTFAGDIFFKGKCALSGGTYVNSGRGCAKTPADKTPDGQYTYGCYMMCDKDFRMSEYSRMSGYPCSSKYCRLLSKDAVADPVTGAESEQWYACMDERGYPDHGGYTSPPNLDEGYKLKDNDQENTIAEDPNRILLGYFG